MWDSSNPDLSGSKLNVVAIGISEDNLAGLRRFSPATFNNLSILKDSGRSGADGGDLFVVAIIIWAFLYYHSYDYTGCELHWFATLGLSIRFRQVGWTFVGNMGFTTSIGAKILVGFWVVFVNGIKDG